ncbi:hypothetical protein REPUB_Repub15cG0123300 [Reevesia pubescens]
MYLVLWGVLVAAIAFWLEAHSRYADAQLAITCLHSSFLNSIRVLFFSALLLFFELAWLLLLEFKEKSRKEQKGLEDALFLLLKPWEQSVAPSGFTPFKTPHQLGARASFHCHYMGTSLSRVFSVKCHYFIKFSSCLQLFDRSGLLYGELARFVLRLLGIRTRRRNVQPAGSNGLPLPVPNNFVMNQKLIEGPKGAASASWDHFWEDVLKREEDPSIIMPSTSINILKRQIKKAKKEVKRLKASTAQMKKEITQLTNMVETHYQGIVKTREAIQPLIMAAESSDAELLQLISALLGDI